MDENNNNDSQDSSQNLHAQSLPQVKPTTTTDTDHSNPIPYSQTPQIPPAEPVIPALDTKPSQTPTPEQPQTTPPTEATILTKQPIPKPGKSKLLLFLFLIIFFLVFAFTGSTIALAYNNYNLFSPPKIVRSFADTIIAKTPLPKTARIVFVKAQQKTADLKSATVETEIEMNAKETFMIKNAKINIKGPADFKNPSQSKSQFDISGQVATEGMQFSAAGSVKIIEDTLYFKFTEVPAGSFLPLENLKNQWFYTKIENFDAQKNADYEQKMAKIKTILEEFSTKSIDWTTMTTQKEYYELTFTPPKEDLADLIYEIIDVVEPKEQSKLETSLDKNKIKEVLDKLKEIKVTTKVNKKDFLAAESKITAQVEVDPIENPFQSQLPSGQIRLAPKNKIPLDLSFTIKLSDIDQPTIVEIPQGAKDIKEYSKQLQNTLAPQLNLDSPLPYEQPTPELLPDEEIPDIENDQTLRDLLEEEQPVLGKKSYWDLIFLKSFKLIN